MADLDEVPMLLPSNHSNTTSARNSLHGSDGIFDRHHNLRSPIHGSESEYEDEDDLVSEMPIDSQAPSCYGDEIDEADEHKFLPYTPSRGSRSPFRNPSSVRGMQLETTPPHLRSPTRESMNKHQSRMSIGSRNSTPRSVRSYRSGSPSKMKTTPVPKKDQPLVLLHVTMLPIVCPYSQAVLEAVAPVHILQNWKLLREKVPDTVLERGILIPHPREEYELLEERLLESLELAIPRILKCGHYHRETTDDEESEAEDKESVHEDHGNESDNDEDICVDCTRRVRDASKGSAGTGKRRWNIRIYAANGLMRAGAWSAAWKEMERVDVEISPWLEDSLRRELDLKKTQEEEDHARQLLEEQEASHAAALLSSSPPRMDEERRREIYGDSGSSPLQTERNFTIGEIVDAYENSPRHASQTSYLDGSDPAPAFLETPSPAPRQPSTIRLHKRQAVPIGYSQEISTAELLQNYIRLLLDDRRNVVLMFLSVVVVWLALRPASSAITPSVVRHVVTEPVASVAEIATSVTSMAKEVIPTALSDVLPATVPSVDGGISSILPDTINADFPNSSVEEIQPTEHVTSDPPIEVSVDAAGEV